MCGRVARGQKEKGPELESKEKQVADQKIIQPCKFARKSIAVS